MHVFKMFDESVQVIKFGAAAGKIAAKFLFARSWM